LNSQVSALSGLDPGDRVERLGMCDCYVEAHKSTVNRHEFSELDILQSIQKFMLQVTHYGRTNLRALWDFEVLLNKCANLFATVHNNLTFRRVIFDN
tara:strand:- start:310 stop:600 length:291 start_codon:yes stop_codon:yes gene_type:complete